MLSAFDLCAPAPTRYHFVASASPSLTAFFDLRSWISRVVSDASRERPARPHSQTSILLRGLFVCSIYVSHADAGRRCLACAPSPSGLLAFWRPLYTLQHERILRSLLVLLYLRSGGDEWAGECVGAGHAPGRTMGVMHVMMAHGRRAAAAAHKLRRRDLVKLVVRHMTRGGGGCCPRRRETTRDASLGA